MTQSTHAASSPRSAAAKREAIVEAAARLFAERGYAGTPTIEIARAASVSDGTVFYHFPTKRALLAEVGRREAQNVLAAAFDGVDLSGPPPDFEAVLRRLFRYAREHPGTYKVFEMAGAVEDVSGGFDAKRDGVEAGVSAALAGWSARGHIRTLDPDIVAALVFALVDTGVSRLVASERWDLEDVWVAETLRALHSLISS